MKKTIIIRVDENVHKKLKIYLIEHGTTIQKYFEEYIKKLVSKPDTKL
ncbi:hypothetical protein [Pectinatus frisingensis]|nr:hypothetical protein [Pectinatus frisingensis]